MPHEDGPLYYASVTILSIGSSCIVEFTAKSPESHKIELFVPERSLVEFSGELYSKYLHAVPFRHSDNLKNVIFGAREDYERRRFDRFSFTLRNIRGDDSSFAANHTN